QLAARSAAGSRKRRGGYLSGRARIARHAAVNRQATRRNVKESSSSPDSHLGVSAFRRTHLETEKQQQIHARALHAPEWRPRVQRLRIGEGRPQSQNLRQVVFDRGFVVGLGAELTAEARDQ